MNKRLTERDILLAKRALKRMKRQGHITDAPARVTLDDMVEGFVPTLGLGSGRLSAFERIQHQERGTILER